MPPGFYKLKVSTAEGSSWIDNYAFTSNFKVLPRIHLRSPFVKDHMVDYFYHLIGTGLTDGIVSGLYPAYPAQTPPYPYPYPGIEVEPYELKYAFISLGLTVSDVDVLYTELMNTGVISVIQGVVSVSLPADPQSLNLSMPFQAYRTDIYYILDAVGDLWTGISWIIDGIPRYEGPLLHGIQSDNNFYFNGTSVGFCHCGGDDVTADFSCFDCQFCYTPGSVCGITDGMDKAENFLNEWGEGYDAVTVNYYGYIHAPVAGNYRFRLDADDYGELTLGGQINIIGIVDFISLQGGTQLGIANSSNNNSFETEVYLDVGYHPVEIRYNNISGKSTLGLYWNLATSNNRNFIFVDPTFIQESQENADAFEAFMEDSTNDLY